MIQVAFDLRDPVRSGIARVATSTLRAFLGIAPGRFRVTVAGPVTAIADLGVNSWGEATIVPFNAGRYSLAAEIQWPHVRDRVGDAVWFFPHFDVPFQTATTRFVTAVHDVMHFEGPGAKAFRGRIARHWMRRSIARSARVHTPSAFTASRLAAIWPDLSLKLHVVPNGVDDLFLEPTRAPLPSRIESWLGGRRYLLSVGNLKKHKNLRVAVDVLRDIPDVVWVVVGEYFADWEEVAAQAIAANVEARILVLPREEDRVLRSLYHNSVCLLFPSFYEGFGLPGLEAMACGTPVVASSATSVPEVLGDCGWLCDPGEPGQFTSAVREVMALSIQQKAIRAERGQHRARTFSWQRAASALAEAVEAAAR